jgi:hypothetical protein
MLRNMVRRRHTHSQIDIIKRDTPGNDNARAASFHFSATIASA